MRRRLAWMRHLVGPVLLLAILASVEPGTVLDGLARARPAPLAAACALVLVALPLRALRWADIVRASGASFPASEALRLYANGTFAGTATPGRVGELSKAAPLVRLGLSPRGALGSVLVDRGFDLAIAACAAVLYGAWLLWGAAAGIAAAVACLALPLGAVAISVPFVSTRAVALTIAGAAAAWLANHLVVVSVGLPLSPLETAGISSVAALATLAPVSVLGVGTRDAALVMLLTPHSIPAGDAVALSTLFLLLNVWTGLACATALVVPPRPLREVIR